MEVWPLRFLVEVMAAYAPNVVSHVPLHEPARAAVAALQIQQEHPHPQTSVFSTLCAAFAGPGCSSVTVLPEWYCRPRSLSRHYAVTNGFQLRVKDQPETVMAKVSGLGRLSSSTAVPNSTTCWLTSARARKSGVEARSRGLTLAGRAPDDATEERRVMDDSRSSSRSRGCDDSNRCLAPYPRRDPRGLAAERVISDELQSQYVVSSSSALVSIPLLLWASSTESG